MVYVWYMYGVCMCVWRVLYSLVDTIVNRHTHTL